MENIEVTDFTAGKDKGSGETFRGRPFWFAELEPGQARGITRLALLEGRHGQHDGAMMLIIQFDDAEPDAAIPMPADVVLDLGMSAVMLAGPEAFATLLDRIQGGQA